MRANNTFRSPLRYPGGKTRAKKHLIKFIPENLDELCSPFIGGGSFELECTKHMIRVYGFDAFKPLVTFWNHLLSSPVELANEVEKYYPLEKDRFYSLRNGLSDSGNINDAAIFYTLNRASFSGTTLSGGMSPNHPRFTTSSIERLREFSNDMLSVECKKFTESIPEYEDTMLYLDPPYMIDSNLYGDKGDMHRQFDHVQLRDTLEDHDNWFMSYNNTQEVLDMYEGYDIHYADWKYGMSNDKDSKEIIIDNRK